jgi:glutathione S-transferase
MPVQLHHHPFSQPSRAVFWFIRHNRIPYEEHVADLAKGEARSPGYLDGVNYFGGVPAIVDDGYQLSEAAAILGYLAGKYRLEKYYPSSLKERSQVDRALHWHHTHLRLCSTQVIFPVLAAFVKGDQDPLSRGDFAKVEPQLKFLEKLLGKQPYLAGNGITIADFFAVPELDQLAWAGFLELDKYPNIRRWLHSLQQLDGYDEITTPREQLMKWSKSK